MDHPSIEAEDLPQEDIRAMSKEEILACRDTRFLAAREEFFSERCIVIATMLEFPRYPASGEDFAPEWYGRARAALIHFRVCRSRLERRIKELNREKSANSGQLLPQVKTDGEGDITTSRQRRDARREAAGLHVAAAD